MAFLGWPPNHPPKPPKVGQTWDYKSNIPNSVKDELLRRVTMDPLSTVERDTYMRILGSWGASPVPPNSLLGDGLHPNAASSGPSGPLPLDKITVSGLIRMVGARMRIPEGGRLPFDMIHAFAPSNDKVFVFVVHKGQGVMLEDDGLFPSDTLIAQLKLILGD